MRACSPVTLSVLVAGVTLAAASLAACGRNDTQAARADSAGLAAPVGSMKPQMDSAVAAGKQTIDSLHQAGVGSKNGLDSTVYKAQAATANDPMRDSGARINNRATPGAGPAAPSKTRP